MEHITLPSGKTVLNLLARKTTSESGADQMTSESGAMKLDQNGICPKCSKQMGHAVSGAESVYWCNSCRVCLPLPIVE